LGIRKIITLAGKSPFSLVKSLFQQVKFPFQWVFQDELMQLRGELRRIEEVASW
jgi:hypothetical protein